VEIEMLLDDVLKPHGLSIYHDVKPSKGFDDLYHIIYVVINQVNSKYYIGKVTSFSPNDGYRGSGVYLWRAINKYGIQNFKRTNLVYLNSSDEAFKLESAIVTNEILDTSHCYNLKAGGLGGFHPKYAGAPNTRWVHNPETLEHRMINKDATLPDGFIYGMSKSPIANKVWITCDSTGDETVINPEEDLPIGWFYGRVDPFNVLGSSWYTNGISQIHIRDGDYIPEGFEKGVIPKKWYYKDKESVFRSEKPDGYQEGRPWSPTLNTYYVVNPLTGKSIVVENGRDLPDGYVHGQGLRKSSKLLLEECKNFIVKNGYLDIPKVSCKLNRPFENVRDSVYRLVDKGFLQNDVYLRTHARSAEKIKAIDWITSEPSS